MEIAGHAHNEFNTVKEKIRHIMRGLFDEEITDDFSKDKNVTWDSLTHLNLIVALENEFDIAFTPEEIGSIFSFRDIVHTVSSRFHL